MNVAMLSLLLMYIPSLCSAHFVLDRQCWYEYPLSVVNVHSAFDKQREYVSFIHVETIPESSDRSPWTYQPLCTHVLPGLNDRLCIYSSKAFGNGRGISIFTTSNLATQFESLPAFQDSFALLHQDVNAFSKTWYTASVPNKGIGVLASKPLLFKERVTAYTPAFLAILENELSTLDREKWWRIGIEQLPDKIKQDFLNLSYVYGDERVRVQDIVKANTFQLEIGGVNHLAVFPETSRLNHACNPNAQYVIDTDHLIHTVHATRPIAKHEEITIAYTSPLAPTSERQLHLQSGFHFTCSCPRCVSFSSDTILSTIQTLQSHLNDWASTSLGSPNLAEQLLQHHRDEGLEGFMDVAYGFAALAYSAVGDRETAKEYAAWAKEAVWMKDGKWTANGRMWQEMVRSVEGHWSWRRRL